MSFHFSAFLSRFSTPRTPALRTLRPSVQKSAEPRLLLSFPPVENSPELRSFQLTAALTEFGDEAGFGGEDPDEEEEEAGGGGHHSGGVGVAKAKEGRDGDRSDVAEE